MRTLKHILVEMEESSAAGAPPVKNWPQVRASLYLIDRCIGLRNVPSADFSKVLPNDYDSLDKDVQSAFPHPKSYAVAHREIFRLLSVLGHVQKPWEAVRVHLRNADRRDLEVLLWPLIAASKNAGLAPAQISAAWVWGLPGERDIGNFRLVFHKYKEYEQVLRFAPFAVRRQVVEAKRAKHRARVSRQVLRRAVSAFDALFEIPSIAESGLLPKKKIGEPPRYDRLGRIRVALPPTLSNIERVSGNDRPSNLQEVYQAICAAGGLGLSADPTPDEILKRETWLRIRSIAPEIIGVKPTTWNIYLTKFKAVLRPYATCDSDKDELLPSCLLELITKSSDRRALTALWRRAKLCAPEQSDGFMLSDFLQLDHWRHFWRPGLDALGAASLRQCEITSRNLLLRAAPDQKDPHAIVRASWTALPSSQKRELAPIRRAAEKAMLKPNEVSREWLSREGLLNLAILEDGKNDVVDLLKEYASVKDVIPSFISDWKAIRTHGRREGIDTSRLGPVEKLAVQDGRHPCEIDASWAGQISSSLSKRANARFRLALRVLDALRGVAEIAHLLPAHSIGGLPDRRRQGNRVLSANLSRELEIVGDNAQHAQNTRRANRTLVAKLFTLSTEQQLASASIGLRELLALACQAGLTGRKLQQARRLQECLPSDA